MEQEYLEKNFTEPFLHQKIKEFYIKEYDIPNEEFEVFLGDNTRLRLFQEGIAIQLDLMESEDYSFLQKAIISTIIQVGNIVKVDGYIFLVTLENILSLSNFFKIEKEIMEKEIKDIMDKEPIFKIVNNYIIFDYSETILEEEE